MSHTSSWTDAASMVDVRQVLVELKCKPTKGRDAFTPCPLCGEVTRGRGDGRGPCKAVGDSGFSCKACGASCGSLKLVLQATHSDWAGVRAWFAARGWCEPASDKPAPTPVQPRPAPPRAPRTPPPPTDELRAALRACTPPASHPGAAAFLTSRGLPATVPAGVLAPDFRARWWPYSQFPLVVPAYDGEGRLRGIHGRAISPTAPRKTTWPIGLGGLLLANREGVHLLRGKHFPSVLIVEGVTDYWTACAFFPPGTPVLGLTSGAAKLLRPLPVDEVVAALDADPAGDRYLAKVVAALAPVPVKRFPLATGQDLSEFLVG